MAITVTISSAGDFDELKKRAGDFGSIGKIIARTLEAQAQRTFLDQAIGDIAWPERYPNQDDPMVNIAALVNWTSGGGKINSRFFDRRPALYGRGDLKKSISARVKGDLVEVGSALPYAAVHQWGGTSTQPVGEGTKKEVARFLGAEKKDGKWRMKKKPGARQKENAEKYWFKLFPLLGKDQLETQVNQRPFLGITDENEADMVDQIETFVAKGHN